MSELIKLPIISETDETSSCTLPGIVTTSGTLAVVKSEIRPIASSVSDASYEENACDASHSDSVARSDDELNKRIKGVRAVVATALPCDFIS